VKRLRRRPKDLSVEGGFTLIELLVASAMGVVLMGAVGTLLVGALRAQPGISQKAADVQTTRFVTERLTRELRAGVVVNKATPSSVSFETYVRHSTCGGSGTPPSATPSIRCEVTYTCAGSSCTRIEAAPGIYTGTPTTVFTGLNNSSSVFTYSPTTSPTYVRVTITIPSTGSAAATTVSDGASLRNATLSN
jgi:prepilin-type N-terminal cleavage/methylation domain-containing protein